MGSHCLYRDVIVNLIRHREKPKKCKVGLRLHPGKNIVKFPKAMTSSLCELDQQLSLPTNYHCGEAETEREGTYLMGES